MALTLKKLYGFGSAKLIAAYDQAGLLLQDDDTHNTKEWTDTKLYILQTYNTKKHKDLNVYPYVHLELPQHELNLNLQASSS